MAIPVGPTRDFPAASALTGLLANALGWERTDWQAHQALQDRLIFAAVIVREGERMTDMQNAKLEKSDKGWTRAGSPEGRAGATYDSPHRRRRDYLADHEVRVVLGLDGQGALTLDDLSEALDRPARPLFLGRKPCLPSAPILAGDVMADTPHGALTALGIAGRALWPSDDTFNSGGQTESLGGQMQRLENLPDRRNWRTGLHGGTRLVVLGTIGADA